MKVYIGADHRGFTLKEQLKKHLAKFDVTDTTPTLNPQDDYPDVARSVAEQIIKDSNSRGIIICGSGIGVDIAANKLKGARAGLAQNTKQIKDATEEDNINILALASDFTEPEDAKDLVDIFLKTTYIPKDRRERRLEKIKNLEDK